jgi:hypothetical protein
MKAQMFLASLGLIASLNLSQAGISCQCSGYTQKHWPIQKQVRIERMYAKALFSGVVIAAVETRNSKGHFLEVRFKVIRSWKNINSRMVTIVTDYPAPGGCGYAFQTGRSYLVYVDRNDLGHLQATICSRTMLVESAAADLRALGRGRRWS